MCMICNAISPEGVGSANDFLSEYSMTQRHMAKAIASLLEVKKHVSPDHARQYDRIHKRMVAISRDWNKIEHQREQHSSADQGEGDGK